MKKILISYDDRKKLEKRGNLYNTAGEAFAEAEKYGSCEAAEVRDAYHQSQLYGYTVIDHTNNPFMLID